MKIIKKINLDLLAFFIVSLIIFLAPYQAFLMTWARKIFSLSNFSYNLLSLWKEYAIFLLFLILIIKYFKNKKIDYKLSKLDGLILIFSFIITIYFFIFNSDISIKLAAVRYDLEFLLIYFIIRLFNFDINLVKKLFKIFLISSLPVIIFGLMQIFLLPPEFMFNFGYERNLLEYSKTGVIPTYDLISPFISGLYRIQSTFPGALQFGSYLVVIIMFCFFYIFKSKEKYKFFVSFLLIISFVALIATYTRAALIGLFLGLSFAIFLHTKNKRKFFTYIVLALFSIVFLSIFLFKFPEFQILILHGHVINGEILGSTAKHFDSLLNSLYLIISNPLGFGLGVVGPASRYSLLPFMSENWYLQIAIEVGILGLIIFIIIMFEAIRELINTLNKIKDNYKYIYLSVLGSLFSIVVMNMFLHTFADTATVYPLFIFIGMLLSLNQKQLS